MFQDTLMVPLGNLLGFFSKRRKKETYNVEELRLAFKARYHRFKLLLNANNRALEVMATMEEALRGTQPFGMTFVLSHCTRVSANVWQVVRHLNDLAPGKYEALFDRFKEIQKKINPFIQHRRLSREGPLVLPLEAVDRNMADLVGSKMANLGEIKNRIQLRVSKGFVITAQGYQRFMEHNDLQAEIDRRIQAADIEGPEALYGLSADIQQLIIRSPLPQDLEKAVLDRYRALEAEEGEGTTVAVRSSALGEDMAGTSFAGQYRSALNVSRENILEAYKEVLASKYSVPAMTYRLNRGIRDEDVAICAGCTSMVDAVSGGVVYSRNPVDIRDDSIVVSSVWGLPKSVVEGSVATDLFIISRGEPLAVRRKEIPVKEEEFVCYPQEGVCRMEMDEDKGGLPSLSEEQVLELARMAVKLEKYYGAPQDIEWATEQDGSIVVLQCRPLQQMERYHALGSEARDDSVILKGGFTASPGAGVGEVFFVKKDMDALRFPQGGVLVTAQALPRWATLLSRTAAVVSEKGSVAGHLANVAREFGVPALFGVAGAVERLRKGQLVTVDADGLRVYEGRVEAVLEGQEEGPKNLMEGSPVFEALKGAGAHIIPLYLLDPDSPHFRPKNCRTFHDITRFCHEKAVYEMFRFGEEHRFPEAKSKRLVCDVPMQFWVINLDDGFREEVEGRHVTLDNIVSIPMRALWEGMTAVPWGGPPPVDAKGFMSILVEASSNPALDPSLRSSFSVRNYFMISKHFCSLQSRFGFHFCTVEALVGKRDMENYISFQFKGGAANLERRVIRAHFVAEILEGYGFQTRVKEDGSFARLEGYDQAFMVHRLRVLGHLLTHTRQLDMVMNNRASVKHHRDKMMADLQGFIRRE